MTESGESGSQGVACDATTVAPRDYPRWLKVALIVTALLGASFGTLAATKWLLERSIGEQGEMGQGGKPEGNRGSR